MAHEHYIPVIVMALTALILGCLNLKPFQSKNPNGSPSGHPSYIWLIALSFLVGVLSVWMYNQKK